MFRRRGITTREWLVSIILLFVITATGQSAEQWLLGEGISGLNGDVYAISRWDPDGAGPKPELIVVGGDFTVAGDVNAPLVAGWDGQKWQSIGNDISAGSGSVYDLREVDALTVYNGQLIAGGYFSIEMGAGKINVARWDGSNWRPMSVGTDGWVYAFTVYNGQLIAGGGFDDEGIVSAWNGTNWQPLGNEMDAGVTALAVYNGQLFAGGAFTTAGGIDVNGIARWDGSAWQSVDNGMSGAAYYYQNAEVKSLKVYDGNLVAGGNFTKAGGVPASFIAAWNGTNWESIDGGMNEEVYVVTDYNGKLIAGGQFSKAGGVSAKNLAQWDGNTWQPVGGGASGRVYALETYDGNLIAGGGFGTAGGITARNIAKWNGSTWEPLGNWQIKDVTALTVHNGQLIAGGTFTTSSGTFAGKVARWDCSKWQPLDSEATNGSVVAMTIYNNKLIVGGSFSMIDGVAANAVAAWDGFNWQPLGKGIDPGFYGIVNAMTVYNGDLIVSGDFIIAGDEDAYRVARWTGSNWQPMGTGFNSEVLALTIYNGQLIAAGTFCMMGCDAGKNIFRWDGSNWQSVGGGIGDWIYALTVYDGNLIAAFEGGGVDGTAFIARWNGSSWKQLGSGVSNGDYNGELYTLAVYNNQLIAGGSFIKVGSTPVNNIIRWDGASWQPMGSGLDSTVSALTVFNGHLIAGGDFITAGGNVSAHCAMWGTPPYESLGRSFVPDSYTAAMPVEVLIEVEPMVSTQGYRIEDMPPAGWEVNVASINEGGIWDPIKSKVQWGPIYDNQARIFTYQVVPPTGATGTKNFNCVFSENCIDASVKGQINQVPQTGNLQVTLGPAGAVSAGAQWNIDWGGWQNSGVTVTDLSVGSHSVNYKWITGWTAPISEQITITNGQTTQINRNYTQQQQQTGNLKVTLGPAGAVSAGAQWNVDGGAWQNSSATVTGLSIGSHTANYKSVTGWDAPISEQVAISNGQTTQISRDYTQQTSQPNQFGILNGKNVKTSLKDVYGTDVMFSLTGGGYGEITGGANFDQIILYGTSEKSQLTVSSKAKDVVSVGDIICNGPLKGISAKGIDITGEIEIGSPAIPNPKAAVTITFDEAEDLEINSDMPIKSISATEWLGGSINAPSVGSITTKGDKKRVIPGDLDVNVTLLNGSINSAKVAGILSGDWTCNSVKSISAADIVETNLTLSQIPDAKNLALGKLTTKGWIDSSQILSQGNIGTVTAGAIINSSCFAGVIATSDIETDGVLDLPGAEEANFDETATIKKITVKGIKTENPPYVINSNIAAANILSATLSYPDNNNGGIPFGISAGFIKTLKIKDAEGTVSFKNLDKPEDSQTFEDAEIRLY